MVGVVIERRTRMRQTANWHMNVTHTETRQRTPAERRPGHRYRAIIRPAHAPPLPNNHMQRLARCGKCQGGAGQARAHEGFTSEVREVQADRQTDGHLGT